MRNAFSLQEKVVISKLRELKNLGPWKQTENFLILVLRRDKWKNSELLVNALGMSLKNYDENYQDASQIYMDTQGATKS